ncbi:hypothetical protein N8J89_07875 [Crossiella sp. CA-258035]|uniref:hypothetical protein n=1 Tax=Crossiella sp. CA-258035 TaxID=2981138 RepID=UPI0024BCECB2|nr:hypothetical protein [Crossiella sp. CA-258035]WHT20972.1 hypothetical protein N8J89_07875 [Crossiella sp. CA-258035]
MPDRIDEITTRVTAASNRCPWEHVGSVQDFGYYVVGPAGGVETENSEQGRADAEFIAHARADVPWLLAEVGRLRELVEHHPEPIFDEPEYPGGPTTYLWTACSRCCIDEDGELNEECGQHHQRRAPNGPDDQTCWPCRTVHATVTALGIEVPS